MQAADLIASLRELQATVGVAESLTGGLVVARLVQVPGASAVVRGGIVSYATDVKARVLGVDADLLATGGAVQAQVARQMAQGARRVLDATYGLATTGVAGPSEQDGQPVGRAFIAVADAAGSRVQTLDLSGDRDAIRDGCTVAVLHLLEETLRDTAAAD